MVRMHVQLTQEQAEQLKRLATERGISTAALIRQGVDLVLCSAGMISREERKRRALAASGRFNSGIGDLAEQHDKYYAEATEV